MKVSIKFILIFVVGIFIGLLASGINSRLFVDDAFFGRFIPLKKLVLSENSQKVENEIELYLNQKQSNSDMWLSFMTILSTLFAVFFVYSGFKIDDTVNKIEDKYKCISLDIEKKVKEIENEITIQKIYTQISISSLGNDYESAINFGKESLDYSIVKDSKDLEYSIYKIIANLYWTWGENEMIIRETSDNQDYYQNAITFIKKAMEIEIGEQDEEILSSYEDRYNYVKNLSF